MFFFIIFDKRGVVIYEEGKQPNFLNDLIRNINTKQLNGSRMIQDSIMEYQIFDQYIFLSLNKTEILSCLIDKYKTKINHPNIIGALGDLANPLNNDDKRVFKITDSSMAKNLNLQTKHKIKESLNFSDGSPVISYFDDEKPGFSFKKAFSLFSSKIKVEGLGPKMVEFLIKKNVAASFAKIITDDVIYQLKCSEVIEVSENDFKDRMSISLSKLIPAIDHRVLIDKIKNHEGNVFSICFIGVNGVGKSTSLAKVACWLLQNGLKVYIAACDTFRAGAIEQLKVHVERFNKSGYDVGFFESGYSKDDASVAKSAKIRASQEGYDVLLIDTAGRMHNKENLMQSLSKLIKINSPEHILFVGEALIGSDSLEHIKEFNRRITEASEERRIDSIILTKVDTVSDKIGQILNLTLSSSAPILFLGTGQSNKDLTPVNSKEIAEILVS